MKTESNRMRLHSRLFSGVGLAALCLSVPQIAMAQDGPETIPAAEEEEARQETVRVTGSRIPVDPNVISSVPIQSVDDSDIQLSGEINLADVVNDIPALVSSLTAENSVTGANSLNLRGLGGERTLTLVNGRRHVAGFRGTQAVDISTIPRGLVERVEVTTGGASAIYGADAVTGVVNFILKDDFEGFEVDVQGGVSSEGDAETFLIEALYGLNFDGGRGNIVFAVGYEEDGGLNYGDRDWARDNGIASVEPGVNPLSLTDPNAPPQAVVQDPRFWLTSQEGSIAPSFGGRSTTYIDINNNGIADCQESEGGRTGFLAGCWLTNPDGTIRVNQDGIVLNGLWGVGGDGGRLNFNRDSLFPKTDKLTLNMNVNYELPDGVRLFFEGKYVTSESETFGEQDTFYDTLFIPADNPFIPTELDPVTAITGGLLLTQDPLDFSDNNPSTFERETIRFVGGAEWEFAAGNFLEFSANHGKFEITTNDTGLYLDRIFAAIDATTDANGNIVCRSDIDPDAFYEIDYFTAGNGFADGAFASNRYYSFTPGDGQCAPLNPFGTYSTSAEARNFVTAQLTDVLSVEQTVLALTAFGQFDVLDAVLDGPIGYAGGLEYREESSDNRLDPLTLGILPEGSSFTPGVFVGEVDPFLNSFISIDNNRQFNTQGEYDVFDVFAEVRLPVFVDRPFAKELTLDAAVRQADYSTIGAATSWKVGGTYAPTSDISFRATFSEAVRAPNITELFDPQLPITISATADPCDPGNVGLGSAVRQQNCVSELLAAGVPQNEILDANGDYIWRNPLTGRFGGTSGGNPNLSEETAETLTVGVVLTPSFIDGLVITADYWDITIEDGIGVAASNDILVGCIDSTNYPNVPFCSDFVRRADGGLTDLTSGEQNFGSIEASGVDFTASYSFDVGPNTFGARLVGSYQEKLDFFFNPLDPTDVDEELGEVQLPELSGNLTLSWDRGPLSVALQTSYQDEQAVDEIADLANYGDGAFFDETYIFDVNASYEYNDKLTLFGGVNNITNEEPFATQTAWPVGPRGTFLFFGVNYRH